MRVIVENKVAHFFRTQCIMIHCRMELTSNDKYTHTTALFVEPSVQDDVKTILQQNIETADTENTAMNEIKY